MKHSADESGVFFGCRKLAALLVRKIFNKKRPLSCERLLAQSNY